MMRRQAFQGPSKADRPAGDHGVLVIAIIVQ